jgi:hypothetical protein
VLGHALYMKMIHRGKAKTDKIDAAKLAGLQRGGLFPMAYVYPTRSSTCHRCPKSSATRATAHPGKWL